MAGLTLDSGALIAAERGDRSFWALWKEAELRDSEVTVPSPVVAQSFRGPRSAVISRVLRSCVVEPLNDELARRVGIVCGESRTADIVDAAVVVSASQRGDDILTSDPNDLAHLIAFVEGAGRILRV
ncbi:MAG: twitching motility protein PilT [Deltaproteobacteria bacterium]|nr:twitching motility protein PilT [Deltaproteobacteria bacterium]